MLQEHINSGSVKLEFEEGKGYIRSLLKTLVDGAEKVGHSGGEKGCHFGP
jgi:hypothetical protein